MVIVFVLVTIVLAAVAIMFCHNPYSWFTTRQWLSMLSADDFRANHASIAIRQVPKDNLFPILREWISETNSVPDSPGLLSKLSIVPNLPPDRKRRVACQAIVLLGPDASPMVPELSAVLFGPPSETLYDAAFALFVMGPGGQSIVAQVTITNSEQAQIAKIVVADMLAIPFVNAALQRWSAQSYEEIALIRVLFNLKQQIERMRRYAASDSLHWRTNALGGLGRRNPRLLKRLDQGSRERTRYIAIHRGFQKFRSGDTGNAGFLNQNNCPFVHGSRPRIHQCTNLLAAHRLATFVSN